MNTALSLVAEQLAVSESEKHFLRAMLTATPVAVRGESTLVPMSSLLAAMGEDGTQESVVQTARGLMKMREVKFPRGSTTFALVDSLLWVDEASFMHCQFNRTFLELLQQVAKQEGVELF